MRAERARLHGATMAGRWRRLSAMGPGDGGGHRRRWCRCGRRRRPPWVLEGVASTRAAAGRHEETRSAARSHDGTGSTVGEVGEPHHAAPPPRRAARAATRCYRGALRRTATKDPLPNLPAVCAGLPPPDLHGASGDSGGRRGPVAAVPICAVSG